MSNTNKTILVFDAMDLKKEVTPKDTLGVTDVPIEAIRANIEVLMDNINDVFSEVKKKQANCKIEHVEFTIGIAVDGSVGIFGSKIGVEATGGITVQIKFE
jgi:hypothetical protein